MKEVYRDILCNINTHTSSLCEAIIGDVDRCNRVIGEVGELVKKVVAERKGYPEAVKHVVDRFKTNPCELVLALVEVGFMIAFDYLAKTVREAMPEPALAITTIRQNLKEVIEMLRVSTEKEIARNREEMIKRLSETNRIIEKLALLLMDTAIEKTKRQRRG